MTYAEAIAFWYGRINYEVKAAGPGDLKLERMRALLRLVNDPQDAFRSVHITGTKGKGSTAAMLAAVLRAAGYRVGLFTSPHLVNVEERVQIDGVPITRDELAAHMAELAEASRPLAEGPTFFELGTALGFLHFAYRRVDVAVVEVGLGGRFDSTNVLRPLVSVITSVGLDHVAQLGDTTAAIAFQKAGIIKSRVPVVSGVTDPAARAVVEAVAREHSAPLAQLDRDFRVERRADRSYELSLLGRHQEHNAALAYETVRRLREAGFTIPESAVAKGFMNTVWPGRVEVVSRNPTVILDTAHNEPSVRALVDTIAESLPVPGVKRCVFAVSNDKPYEEMLAILARSFDELYLTKYAQNTRGVTPERLAEIVKGIDPTKRVRLFAVAADALSAARAVSGKEDLIGVTGSFFLAGELRPVMVA
jgi:dihydrofolate synthase/folylpolyglutamate synthase